MRQSCQSDVWTETMNSTCVSTNNTTIPSPSPHPASLTASSISFEGHVRVLTPTAGFEATMKAAMELESSLSPVWNSSSADSIPPEDIGSTQEDDNPKVNLAEENSDKEANSLEQNKPGLAVKQEKLEHSEVISEQVPFEKSPTEDCMQDESSMSDSAGEYGESRSPIEHNGYSEGKIPENENTNRSGISEDNDEDNPLRRLEYALEQNGMFASVYNSHCEEGDFMIENTDKHGVKTYRCPLCPYTASTRHSFECHLNDHYDQKCNMCDFTGKTEGHLRDHLRDVHSMCIDDQEETGIRVPRVNSQGKVKTFKCKQCQFVALTKLDFWEHSRSHIKAEKLLTCPKCPFVTEYKHHLEYHLRNHFGSKPFKCNKCSYSCVNKSMLNSHLKSHSNVYQYRCSDCTYATKYCHSLKLHLRKYNHKPSMVLNPDGSPNPFPIIDVYGTRRGPKLKKDENGFPKYSPHSIPVHNNSYGMSGIHHPSPHMPTNLPLPYSVPYYNSYNQNNQFMNKDKIPLTEDDDSMETDFKNMEDQEREKKTKSPRRIQSPHESSFHQGNAIKCNLCDFVTFNREHFSHHMMTHASSNCSNISNSPKIRNGTEENKSHERQHSQESVRPSQVTQSYQQNHTNSNETNHVNQIQKELSSAPGNLSEFPSIANFPFPASEEIKEYLARMFSTSLLFGSRGMSVSPQARDQTTQSDQTSPNASSPSRSTENNYKKSQTLESESPQKTEDRNGIPLDLTKEGSVMQDMDNPELATKNRRKGKAFKLERIALKLQERQPNDQQNNNSDSFETSDEAEIEETVSSACKQTSVKSPKSNNERSTSRPEEKQEQGSDSWCDAYHCDYCDIAFRDIVMYTMHMGYHGFKDPFKCNMCGQETSDKVAFFLHIARSSHR